MVRKGYRIYGEKQVREIQWLKILKCLKLLWRDYDNLDQPNYFTDEKIVSEKLLSWCYIDGSKVRQWDIGRSLESLSIKCEEAALLLFLALGWISSLDLCSFSSIPVSQVSFWAHLLHIPVSWSILCHHLDFHLIRLFPSLHSFSLLADLEYNCCDIPEETWTGRESDVAYASYIPGSIIWAKQYGYPW